MTDIRVGDQIFAHPILNSSGCWCKNFDQITNIYNSYEYSGVISKTCGIKPYEGNPEPNLLISNSQDYILNCMGLPNNGFYYYAEHFKLFTEKPYILSLNGNNIDELLLMLTKYNDIIASYYCATNSYIIKQLVEINISCPNICNNTEIIGYHPEIIENICDRIATINLQTVDIGFKLPPYLEIAQLQQIAHIFIKYQEKCNIKFIVCSNTIPNGLVLDNTGKPILSSTFGGISYSIVNKLLGISNVYQFKSIFNSINNNTYNTFNIKIIGCGGIKSNEDIDDYLKAGADLIQIGSYNLLI